MNNKKAERLIEAVAQKNGVTTQEVRRELETMIKQMFSAPSDELTRFRQSQIACKGARPTPEELIVYLVGRM